MLALTLEQMRNHIAMQERNPRLRNIRICIMSSHARKEFFFVDGHGYMRDNELPGIGRPSVRISQWKLFRAQVSKMASSVPWNNTWPFSATI